MAKTPTHGQLRRACAAVLEAEGSLSVRQIAARLKRSGMLVRTREVEQELLAAPAVFRHDSSEPIRWSVDSKWREALLTEPVVLRYLQLKNWKAFASAEIQVRDMTLLFGENSAGKSSILQALLMLKQSYGQGEFRFEGDHGSFGDLKNVVHRHDPSSELGFIAGWEMQLEPGLILIGLSSEACETVAEPQPSGRIKTILYSPLPLTPVPEEDAFHRHSAVMLRRTYFHDPDEELSGPAWAFDLASNPDSGSDAIEFFLHESREGWPGFEIVSAVAETEHGTVTATVRGPDVPSTTTDRISESLPDAATQAAQQMGKVMTGLMNDFKDSLEHFGEILKSVVHIGPTRSVPSRWTALGDLPTDDYLRRLTNSELAARVNYWLDLFDVPFELSVETRNSADHDQLVRLTVQRVDGEEKVQLQDIGYGVSQLLPVIVQLVANQEKTILVEEPEAHVHPRLQSVLGDLFVESTQLRGNVIIAETHSEPLLLRLQRRIAEGNLNSERVSVFNVVRDSDSARAETVKINANGQLDYQWPGGFFDDRIDDLVAILDPTSER